MGLTGNDQTERPERRQGSLIGVMIFEHADPPARSKIITCLPLPDTSSNKIKRRKACKLSPEENAGYCAGCRARSQGFKQQAAQPIVFWGQKYGFGTMRSHQHRSIRRPNQMFYKLLQICLLNCVAHVLICQVF